ncbi:hypothetical protein N2152v2_006343 [Parachlorella kessleri]
MEEAQAGRPVRPKQPYLRRGSGWETRVQAAKEGRRYRPKGGTVYDYGSEQLGTGAASHKAPSKVAPTRQKGSSASPTKSARSGTQSAMSAQQSGRSPAKKAGQLDRQSAPRPQARHAAEQSQKQHIGSSNSQAGLAGTGVPPANAGLLHPATKSAWAAGDAEQDLELREFCALESEVLREVSNNTIRPASSCSPGPAASAKAWGLAADQCSSAKWSAMQLGDGSGAAEDEAAEEEDDEEDVFEPVAHGSVWGGNSHYSNAGERTRRVSFADSSLHCPDGSRTVVEEEEEEGELDAQSELIEEEIPMKPTSSLVQKFFFSQKVEKAPLLKQESTAPEELLRKQVEELEEQVKRLNEERSRVAQQRKQVEEAKAKVEQEKAALEKRKAEELAQVEALKIEELRKLQRDRRVLEKQSRALLKLPTKREKEEIQALEAVLEKERQNGRGKDARHKLTVDRLRRQILELQEKNRELQEQVQFLEAQRLQEWQGGQGSLSPSKHGNLAAGGENLSGQQAADPGKKATTADARPCQQQQQQQDGQPPSLVASWEAAKVLAEASAACEEPDDSSDCEESGCVVAEELTQDMLTTTLPTVRVSVHNQRQQQQPMPPAFSTDYRVTPMTTLGAETLRSGALEQAAQQTSVQLANATALPTKSHEGSMSVMQKGTSALSHFNQLKESLLQNGALQQKLTSRLNSLQVSPAIVIAEQNRDGGQAAVHAQSSFGLAAAAGPAHKVDDLRMLGRMLTTSAAQEVPLPTGASSSFQHQGILPQQPVHPPQPAGPGATTAPNTSQPTRPLGQVAAVLADAAPSPAMVVSERQCDDGRVEKVLASGVKVQEFPNGSRKQQWPDGRAMTRFGNGDVKVAWPNGRVDYYYAAVDCWQVTHAGGVEVFFFASGQVEAHHPGGIKEIIFPEGGMRKVLPDGRELVVTALHLSKEIKLPRPEAPDL